MDEGTRGVEAQRFPVAGDRPREIARALPHHCEVRMRVRSPGVDRDRLSAAFLRFLLESRSGERPTEL